MMNQLLINQPPIQVMPALAQAVGFDEAAVLQIMHYWLSPTVNKHFKDGCYWIQNLIPHLHGRFFFWGYDTLAYMIAGFEASGILIAREEVSPAGVPLSYHTINYEELQRLDPTPSDYAPYDPCIPEIIVEANSNIHPSIKEENKL